MSFRSALIDKSFILKDLEEKVKKAKSEKKIFLILEGYEPLRQSLLARDWIEKVPDDKFVLLIPSTSEKFVTALLLKNFPFFFVWQPRSRPIKNLHNVTPYTNSIIRTRNLDFTAKDGLHNCAENYRWHHIDGVTELNYQRSHILDDKTARDEFAEDFRRTAVTSFILFLDCPENIFELFFSNDALAVPADCIGFAIQKVELHIKIEQHGDIDTSPVFDICARFPKHHKEFLTHIRQVTNGTRKLKFESYTLIAAWKQMVHDCAEMIRNHWPHLKYDGFRNVWILKPIGTSSGWGVRVMNAEEAILSAAQTSQPKCIVQKYVENPLLIQNRKFDMRIYFITFIREDYVDIWLYKDCYVKFGTSAFTLSNLHQSIHVTNYAVQKHFMNSIDAVDNARENMWSLDELKKYFAKIGEGGIWSSRIYPAIKKNLVTIVMESLDVTDFQENNFELNGADFMIGFDYQPILIEVNAKPALFFSPTVVEMITKKLLDDVIKVTVDWQRDQMTPTGDFELIYTFEIPKVENTIPDIAIQGNKIEIYSARVRTSFNETQEKPEKKQRSHSISRTIKDGKATDTVYFQKRSSK